MQQRKMFLNTRAQFCLGSDELEIQGMSVETFTQILSSWRFPAIYLILSLMRDPSALSLVRKMKVISKRIEVLVPRTQKLTP